MQAISRRLLQNHQSLKHPIASIASLRSISPLSDHHYGAADCPRHISTIIPKVIPNQIKSNVINNYFAFSPLFNFHLRGFASESHPPRNEAGSVPDFPATPAAPSLKTVYRPLSPHLSIYKPQINSTTSIFNRISGAYLSALILAFYLVCVKMGSVCFTFDAFYHFLFYSLKLTLISVEIAALALSYHIIKSLQHLIK